MYNGLKQKINHVNFIFKPKTNCLVLKSEHEADYIGYKFYEGNVEEISKNVKSDVDEFLRTRSDIKTHSLKLNGLII